MAEAALDAGATVGTHLFNAMRQRLADDGAIAGSTLTVAAAVRFAVAEAGLPLAEVVRAATASPAAVLGLEHVGSLSPGSRADLVVLELDVLRVLHRGAWVRAG